MSNSEDIKKTGLINKYAVSRMDGRPLTEADQFFLLRLEGGSDPIHLEASRLALVFYAVEIKQHLPALYEDIMSMYGWTAVARRLMKDVIYDNGFVDRDHPEGEHLYDLQHVLAVKRACRVFFNAHPSFLNLGDMTSIAIGNQDDNEELYGRWAEFAALRDALNTWYESLT